MKLRKIMSLILVLMLMLSLLPMTAWADEWEDDTAPGISEELPADETPAEDPADPAPDEPTAPEEEPDEPPASAEEPIDPTAPAEDPDEPAAPESGPDAPALTDLTADDPAEPDAAGDEADAPDAQPAKPTPVEPSATVDSGSCGTNVTWSLSDSGTLTVSGILHLMSSTSRASCPSCALTGAIA